jgi:vacuolar-type H+-ATPase subunit E/Vma4
LRPEGEDVSSSLPMSSALAGFKRALLEQRDRRHAALKSAADDDLAGIITARRLEVERAVPSMRKRNQARLSEGIREYRRAAGLKKKECEPELMGFFLEKLEEAVRLRLKELRASGRYREVMEALAAEAQKILGPCQAALVEKGDEDFLAFMTSPPRPDGFQVRGELEDSWGGLVMVGSGGRLVDNTLKTRWKRLSPSLMTSLHRDFFSDFSDFSDFTDSTDAPHA